MLLTPAWLSKSLRGARACWPILKPHRTFATARPNPLTQLPEKAIHLRAYQEECIQSVLSSLSRGEKRLGISLATGSGKTVVFTQLIDRVQPQSDSATQTLILAHRRELVQQAARHCEKAYPGKSIEIEMGETHASGYADITVASIQSLLSGDRLSKYDAARFKLVLVDEAHHIVAPGYLQTLKHFGLEEHKKDSMDGPALVGVSATFSRFDGLRLGAAIDHIVFHKDYIDMIGEKWLADMTFTTIKSKANLSKVALSKDGDFAMPSLSRAVNTPENNEITFRSWQAEAGDRKSTLVFCVDVAHVTDLTDVFRRNGIDAQYITSSTKKRLRAERLEAFKFGAFPVLLNCGIFTEGTDIPNIDCVLLARPTKSRNLLVQMIGRGTRLYPGKEECHVIDMVTSLQTGIVSVPTLYGLDPSEIVTKATAAQMKELQASRKEESEKPNQRAPPGSPSPPPDVSEYKLTMTHYSSIHDLINDTSGERHIRSLSPNAWVQVSNDKYILSTQSGILTILAIQPDHDQEITEYSVNYKYILSKPTPSSSPSASPHSTSHRKPKAPYSRPRVVASVPTLPAAIAAADTFATRIFPRALISKTAPWRLQPATPTQVAFLNQLRNPSNVGSESESESGGTSSDSGTFPDSDPDPTLPSEPALLPDLTPETINKGRAADMLTKWKHGARGTFGKIERTKRAAEREEGRMERFRERNRVVGVGRVEA